MDEDLFRACRRWWMETSRFSRDDPLDRCPDTILAMIRLSCLTLSYQNQFRAGRMDIFSFLTTCRALDLDGADIHINSLKNTSIPHLKEVRRNALDQGLSISCLGVSTEFGRSAETISRELNKAKEAIGVGMFLGAPVLRVFVGSAQSPDKTN